jgi:simple sugar transport system ATP-binding protein
MRGITKSFGELRALDQVDLSVEKGTIHAIVGENGAGKTTLMRILYGAITPDSGETQVNGQQKQFKNSAQAIAEGIGMVSQHYGIIPELTCLQNLILGEEPGWWISQAATAERANELAAQMGFNFDWAEPARNLSPAGAQKLEILKLLWRKSNVLILDEPTAMLSPADSETLFGSLKKLVSEGATVILVTHRLPEVMSFCSHVTILRGGSRVADLPVSETDSSRLAQLMVGEPVAFADWHNPETGATAVQLELKNVRAKGYRGDDALKGVDLQIRVGEVVGIAGVDGNGQRELAEVIIGALRPSSGEISWEGKSLADTDIRSRLSQGFRLIPEDRHSDAMIGDWPIKENAALGLQRQPPFSQGAFIDTAGRATAAQEIANRLDTKLTSLADPMSSLSGGNQQRFVAARALYREPKLIIALQPTRGLDIQATNRLFSELREECRKGACALVISFDLDEILEHCDRVLVMHQGKLTEPEPGRERDRQAIGRLMAGVG